MRGTLQLGRAVGAIAVALWLLPARGADVALQLQPGYSYSTVDTRDATGQEHRLEGSTWLQRYRLTLDLPIYPQVILSAGGLLDWNRGTGSVDGAHSSSDTKQWIGFAHLRAGSPLLSAGLDYDRRDTYGESTTGGITATQPRQVSDSYGASVGWHPADLPSLDLQLHRVDSYDWTRKEIDRTFQDALLSTRYRPVDPVDLGLSIRGEQADDRITQVLTRGLTESVRATYSDSYLGGRASAYVSYNGAARVQTVSASGAAGTVPTLQVPAAGLSIVEVFPAIPTQVTLSPNAALVDGNTTVSSGINLGFSASAGGLRQYRDLGAQFANVITPVNAVYVWVDRQIPADAAATFVWEAYQSDDNVNWTRVTVTGPVQFSQLQSRFEIPIERTQARYLKVVTRPLVGTVTTDPQLSEIFVTEAQFLLLVPAAEARGRSSDVNGSVNATGRLALVQSIGLTYDVSSTVTHSSSARVTWAINNGLSASRRLGATARWSARVDRSDVDVGRGHESSNRWAGSLFVEPLPTLAGGVTYSGQYSQSLTGNVLLNSLSLLGRADLYEGIALSVGGTGGIGTNERSQTVKSSTGSASLSVTPNRYASASGSASYTASSQTGGTGPQTSDRRVSLDAAATINPLPVLALSGTISRFLSKTQAPQTVWSFSLSFSPLPGGNLQVRYAYQETYDSATEARSRQHGPSLRWNIRPGWYLDSSYSWQRISSPVEETRSQSVNANLIITLR